MSSFGPLRTGVADHLKQRIDYASTTIQYIGYASPGSLTSSSVWAIQRLTFDSNGRITQVDWADGAANANQIWDNRATLDYS